MSIDYKYKADKYKAKYFNLLNQKGGNPVWYNEFEKSLQEIDNLLTTNGQEHILTGTSAIAYVLCELKMTELLDEFEYPCDIDYLYETSNNTYITKKNFGDFVRLDNLNKDTNKKACYERPSDGSKRINKIDFTGVYKIKHSKVGKYDIVNINTLYNMYLFCDKEKNIERIKILEKIIDHVKQKSLTQTYNLDDDKDVFQKSLETTNLPEKTIDTLNSIFE